MNIPKDYLAECLYQFKIDKENNMVCSITTPDHGVITGDVPVIKKDYNEGDTKLSAQNVAEKNILDLTKTQDEILDWGIARNLTKFSRESELSMLEEELQEYNDAVDADDIHEKIDALCDIYVVFTQTMSKAETEKYDIYDDKGLMEYFLLYNKIPQRIQSMGYDFRKCMIETLKEINSRLQDPEQKREWTDNGVSGKFQKWIKQPIETLYKADYSKGLIKR